MTSAGAAPPEPISRLNSVAASTAVMTFSIGMGVATIAMPLLALQAGLGSEVVGLLAAGSAVAQLVCRLFLPLLLRYFSDRAVVGMSALLQAVSYAILLFATSLAPLAAAQLLQGAARGFFWTSSQTHAVRGPTSAVRALAQLNVMASIGQFIGPLVAGLLAGPTNLAVPVLVACVVSVVAWVSSFAMHRFDLIVRESRPREQGLWRRPAVRVGSMASFTSGGWWAIRGSYVPVILSGAGLPTSVIGGLVAASTATNVAIPALLYRLPANRIRLTLYASVVVTVVAIVLLPFIPGNALVAGFLLAVSGAGAGALIVLGPAYASGSAEPSEQGEVMAITGTFRAVALLVTPGIVAGLLSVVSLAWAMALAGLVIGVPVAVLSGRLPRRR